MEEVEAAIEAMLPEFGCTLMTMPGIDIITAANILAEIGNIDRFPNAKKLAKFAGIAPINFSSAGKGKDMCPKQGNPEITAIFYFLAIQMVQVAPSGTPRNALFREYFLKKLEEGKNKPQALICIARRLVNIVYGMLKNHTEYREPEKKNRGRNCLKEAVGTYIMEKRTADESPLCSFSAIVFGSLNCRTY